MSKHFIRVNDLSQVTYGFSDAFEQPLDTDICINESGGRHLELLGELNPPILDLNNCHRFIYEGVTRPEKVPVEEDATDEAKIDIDTSEVSMDDEEAVLENVEVNNQVTVTARGYKTIYVTSYTLRYATEEELSAEYESIRPVEELSLEEQITELQLALCDQYELNETLSSEVTNNELALCELYSMIGGE